MRKDDLPRMRQADAIDEAGMIRGIGTTDEALYVGTLKGIVYAYAPVGAKQRP